MFRVFVVSPFGGKVENQDLATAICYAVVSAGGAPFAPHLLYPSFLEDHNEAERAMGIQCGMAWLEVADVVLVYTGNGVTRGMRQEWRQACAIHKVIAMVREIADVSAAIETARQQIVEASA